MYHTMQRTQQALSSAIEQHGLCMCLSAHPLAVERAMRAVVPLPPRASTQLIPSVIGPPSRAFGTIDNATAAARPNCWQQIVQVVDQRTDFLRDGPLTQVCLRTGGWWSPIIRTRHGTAPVRTYGDADDKHNM